MRDCKVRYRAPAQSTRPVRVLSTYGQSTLAGAMTLPPPSLSQLPLPPGYTDKRKVFQWGVSYHTLAEEQPYFGRNFNLADGTLF
jgi:hypothetical protein